MRLLVDWKDHGEVSTLPRASACANTRFLPATKRSKIAPGIRFPAWAYNARVPGPTIRCTEGDRTASTSTTAAATRTRFIFTASTPSEMDGVPGAGPGEIQPGQEFIYEFDAYPFGCHLYHCHAAPLKRHIHKGLYGAFIVDPPEGRPPAREFMMMMNAFDTNFDNKNEIYAVNTVGHEFARRPIPIKVGERVRLYLINIIEFDPINSLHLHAEFFDYYDHGTTLEPTHRTVDTIIQCQAQRGLVESPTAGRASTCFTPTRVSLPSWAGWASSAPCRKRTGPTAWRKPPSMRSGTSVGSPAARWIRFPRRSCDEGRRCTYR